jgi:lathosterol oxidase
VTDQIFGIVLLGIHVLYFVFATLSYYLVCELRFLVFSLLSGCDLLMKRKSTVNHEMMKHPRFLKGQVRMEIMTSLKAFRA